jgi:hypothetical protein
MILRPDSAGYARKLKIMLEILADSGIPGKSRV